MLVFIDESGDAGFDLDAGSTPVFVAGMVLFKSAIDAASTDSAIAASPARRRHKGEFKFSRCSDEVRDAFFASVTACPFGVRAIVVRKERVRSARLRVEKGRFYTSFLRQMVSWYADSLSSARIVIDGSADQVFRRSLQGALKSTIPAGVIRDVRVKDSRRDALVQLADMCVGAIARSYRDDRDRPDRWRQMLGNRLLDVREF